MKRTDLREFCRDFYASLRVTSAEVPGVLPVMVVSTLINSAFPFVNIILGAKILDRLLAGGDGVMGVVWWMVGLNFFLGLTAKVLQILQENQLYKSNDLTEMPDHGLPTVGNTGNYE